MTLPLLFFLLFLASASPPDPDDRRSFTEMVEENGYACEWHEAVTIDGYILGVARIPRPGSPPVLLLHGFLDSCFSFVFNYHKEQNLAYILSDKGYDVWMGNNRGNNFSLKHETLDPNSNEFWDFSLDEMAAFDVPAFIDYVRNVTSFPKLAYLAHSEGTSIGFAALSTQPDLPISSFVALGPVAHVRHSNGIVVDVFRDTGVLDFVKMFGNKRFMPTPKHLGPLFGHICEDLPKLCLSVVEMICGWHKGAINESRMQVMATHEPAGSSIKNMLHWRQLMRSGRFAHFDYGEDANLKRYNQTTPPDYDVGKIPKTLPMAFFAGTGDLIVDAVDLEWLLTKISPSFLKRIPRYGHLDYMWCTTAFIDVYRDVVAFLS